MKIDSVMPFNNYSQYTAVNKVSSQAETQKASFYGQGVIVEISRQARDAYKNSIVQANGEIKEVSPAQGVEGCQTCKNRRYVDESNDSSVSYQSPTHISPEASASKVMAHEREHVTNEQARAERDNRRVVSQTVSLSTSICPECGKVYVSGGTTRTVTAGDKKAETQAENSTIPSAGAQEDNSYS